MSFEGGQKRASHCQDAIGYDGVLSAQLEAYHLANNHVYSHQWCQQKLL